MSLNNHIKLSTGALIPALGLGTWLSKPKEVEHAVSLIRYAYPSPQVNS